MLDRECVQAMVEGRGAKRYRISGRQMRGRCPAARAGGFLESAEHTLFDTRHKSCLLELFDATLVMKKILESEEESS